jgi:medium-chain acyl-[acyl-carrier-protein] hydrolase
MDHTQLTIWTEEFSIRNFEADFQQRWKPSSIFQTLTEAASRHAASLGFDNLGMLADGKIWVLSRLKIHINTFPVIGQCVTLRTWPKDIFQKLFFRRDFELFDESGQQMAAATSYWLLIDTQTRRLLKPEALGRDLPHHPDLHALTEPVEKINPPEGLPVRHVVTAGYSTIDLMGHVNNSRYVDWVTDCFNMEDFRRQRIAWIQVNYSSEVQPEEQVSITADAAKDDPDQWLFEGKHADGTRAFEAALKWEPSNR